MSKPKWTDQPEYQRLRDLSKKINLEGSPERTDDPMFPNLKKRVLVVDGRELKGREIWEKTVQLPRCKRFTAVRFEGSGRYTREEFPTEEAARTWAREELARPSANPRPFMIYGITPETWTIFAGTEERKK